MKLPRKGFDTVLVIEQARSETFKTKQNKIKRNITELNGTNKQKEE